MVRTISRLMMLVGLVACLTAVGCEVSNNATGDRLSLIPNARNLIQDALGAIPANILPILTQLGLA